MKPIPFEQWREKFDVKPSASDDLDTVTDQPAMYTFYDNGAVADCESNFLIKADQTKPKGASK